MAGPARTGGAPLLILRAVGKTVSNGVTALDGVDMTLREGDFLSLLGPSGCGKSTALRIVAGLASPTTGVLDWGGKAMARGDIGFVFQEPTLMPWANVADNVRLPLKLRRAGRAEADARVARHRGRDRDGGVAARLDQAQQAGHGRTRGQEVVEVPDQPGAARAGQRAQQVHLQAVAVHHVGRQLGQGAPQRAAVAEQRRQRPGRAQQQAPAAGWGWPSGCRHRC